MYEPIIDALRRGAAAEALAAALAAVERDAADAGAQRLLAAALHLGDDRDGAITAVDRAIALVPHDAELHLYRAVLASNENEPALAVEPLRDAWLAVGRGDLVEADRLCGAAAALAPEHPHVLALQALVRVRRGDVDGALAMLGEAAAAQPDAPILRQAMAFTHLARGDFPAAEQAFRGILENGERQTVLRLLIADTMQRQGRAADAAAELMPLLDGDATPDVQRAIGELLLEAGDVDAALAHLRESFAAQPGDRRTILALMAAWRRLGDLDTGRATLEEALQANPRLVDLWRARRALEEPIGDAARAVIDRWLAALPETVPALEALAAFHDLSGDAPAALEVAHQIVALDPDHGPAETRLINDLLVTDPAAAVARIEALAARATDPDTKRAMEQLLGLALVQAGRHDAAVAQWAQGHAELVGQRLPLPAPGIPPAYWPPATKLARPAPAVLLLWGAPGSMVERIAATLAHAGAPLRTDRFGPQPPRDFLQRTTTVAALGNAHTAAANAAAMVAEWRATLRARAINDGRVCDWLLWWDNALLSALRPFVPEALLLVALRDPRDMLVDWLAFGAPARFALPSPLVGAKHLAAALGQIAELHERDLMPHRLVRLDGIGDDANAIAEAVGGALGVGLPALPQAQLGPSHLAAGRWREFAEPLADAFALLTPVAVRLGYAEA